MPAGLQTTTNEFDGRKRGKEVPLVAADIAALRADFRNAETPSRMTLDECWTSYLPAKAVGKRMAS